MGDAVVLSYIITRWIMWAMVLVLLLALFLVFTFVKSIRRHRGWILVLVALVTLYVAVPTIQGVMDMSGDSYITEHVRYYRSDASNTRNKVTASESIQVTLEDGRTLILIGAQSDMPYGRYTGQVTYAERSKVIIDFVPDDSQ